MKKTFVALLGLAVAIPLLSVHAITPFDGKLIALDAGHGGTETGATNTKYGIAEKDVNLAVVLALKARLEGTGATVVLTREGDETIASRKERVQIAMDKCLATLARKCDILVSIHHNGNSDPLHDGTLAIYNEKQDIPLATALHDALVPLTGIDEGYLSGGYGITVYNHLVSALTEAYYITNDDEALAYRDGNRTNEEVEAQFLGLTKYFNSNSGGKGGKPR
ncbi:MAG: N-acetylmuramoyl-L-alanine amidase [Parcubacteria group bacterium]|nr:N-acetylmuramoyl-L-alanine amidase [Parcubacteria group bacterium]